jgi:hypothetical protein
MIIRVEHMTPIICSAMADLEMIVQPDGRDVLGE